MVERLRNLVDLDSFIPTFAQVTRMFYSDQRERRIGDRAVARIWLMAAPSFLGQDVVDDLSMNVRQSEIPSLEAVR